jgi:hypothetical protein
MSKALILGLFTLLMPAVASAQIHQVSSSPSEGKQTINFYVGYFAMKGIESRVTDDVLVADLTSGQPLAFLIKDFNGAPFGGEWLFGIGRNFEAGVGLGYFQRSVPSVYANVTHSNGAEIFQELKLKMVPVTFTARFLPLPRGSSVEPYFGGGLVAIRWRYSEAGEFVDDQGGIFPAVFVGDGTDVGPIVLGGVRFPFGPMVAGGEVRWQKVEGSGLPTPDFLGTKIDLGGWTGNFTFGFRF